MNEIIHGDCIEVMKSIPDKSIDLVIADIPYNIGKDKRWDKWKKQSEYIDFIGKRFLECQRVLKDNGSFYWFHNDFQQMSLIQGWLNKNTDFSFRSLITIEKEEETYVDVCYPNNNFYSYINKSEYLLFYNFFSKDFRSKYVLDYFDRLLSATGLSKSAIKSKVPLADHCFRVSEDNFAFPTEKTYSDIVSLIRTPFKVIPLNELKPKFDKSFGLDNIWRYKFKSNINHPTPKPIELIENIINHSSNENDTILDPFSGSGTTAIACINTNRNYICIEKDKTYFALSVERVNNHKRQSDLFKPQ